nr:hypothetical protein Iba_chr09dCG15660 [Ipomoea batatas]
MVMPPSSNYEVCLSHSLPPGYKYKKVLPAYKTLKSLAVSQKIFKVFQQLNIYRGKTNLHPPRSRRPKLYALSRNSQQLHRDPEEAGIQEASAACINFACHHPPTTRRSCFRRWPPSNPL